MRTDDNYKKKDWDLIFVFSMPEAQMDPNKKKAASWPWKWNHSLSQTQIFVNG